MSRRRKRSGKGAAPGTSPTPPAKGAAGASPTPHKKRATAPAPPPRRRSRWFLAGVLVAGLLGVAVWWTLFRATGTGWPEPRAAPAPRVAYGDFVGSDACEECHAAEYDVWRRSTHGRAGGPPDSVHLLRPFDGRRIEFRDAVVTPRQTPEGRYQFEVVEQGKPAQVLTVTAVVGGGHMHGGGTQGFLTAESDGTTRFLPFDYSAGANTWFCNTSGRINQGWVPISAELPIGACADWPPFRMLGEFEGVANCEQCHGSQITLERTPTGQFRTRYTTLDINCESCHGPGREHIVAMREGRPAPDGGIGMKALATLDEDASLAVCFQCHALKVALTSEPYLPGDDFEEFYSVKLAILVGSPHFPDGRMRTFGYQETHLASDCYVNGRMTCTDCHDPHSGDYRDVSGRPLVGRFDDGQCTDCHPSQREEREAHTHHRAGTPGSGCVDCHMPYLQHPSVGRAIPYGRSDHAITIPRPELDVPERIVGACERCHEARSPDQLERDIAGWWGPVKPLAARAQALIQARAEPDRAKAAALLLADDPAPQQIAQFAGLSHLFLQRLSADMFGLEPAIVSRLEHFAEDPDDDVAALALASLHYAQGKNPAVRRFLGDQLRQLGSREIAVRRRWAYILRTRARSAAITHDPVLAGMVYRKLLELEPGDAEALAALRR